MGGIKDHAFQSNVTVIRNADSDPGRYRYIIVGPAHFVGSPMNPRYVFRERMIRDFSGTNDHFISQPASHFTNALTSSKYSSQSLTDTTVMRQTNSGAGPVSDAYSLTYLSTSLLVFTPTRFSSARTTTRTSCSPRSPPTSRAGTRGRTLRRCPPMPPRAPASSRRGRPSTRPARGAARSCCWRTPS